MLAPHPEFVYYRKKFIWCHFNYLVCMRLSCHGISMIGDASSLYSHRPEYYLGLPPPPPRIVDDSFPYPGDICRDLHLDKEQASKIIKLIEERLMSGSKSKEWEYVSSKKLEMPCKILFHVLSKRVILIPKKTQVPTYGGLYKICRMALILTIEKAEPIFHRVCHQKEPKKSIKDPIPPDHWKRESQLYNLFASKAVNPFVAKFYEISSFEGKQSSKHPRHAFYEYYPEDLFTFLGRKE